MGAHHPGHGPRGAAFGRRAWSKRDARARDVGACGGFGGPDLSARGRADDMGRWVEAICGASAHPCPDAAVRTSVGQLSRDERPTGPSRLERWSGARSNWLIRIVVRHRLRRSRPRGAGRVAGGGIPGTFRCSCPCPMDRSTSARRSRHRRVAHNRHLLARFITARGRGTPRQRPRALLALPVHPRA